MSRDFTQRRPASPLDRERLEALALHYVGRYATTRAKLAAYLTRKVREKGWAEEGAAPIAAIVGRLGELGYVDDAGFATMRAAALTRRGYGARRVSQALHAAGVDETDSADAREAARGEAAAAALAFARRKRIGPYAATVPDRDGERRALAAMLRAGHDMTMARAIAAAAPGEVPELPSG